MIRKRGFSLTEVLIAAAILGAILVPTIMLFLFSTGAVGQDVNEIKAAAFAEEIMEQVAAIHRITGHLPQIPGDATGSEAQIPELDLDAAIGVGPQQGDTIKRGVELSHALCVEMRMAWVSPSPSVNGFHRYLSIQPEATLPSTPALTARVLWHVRVRVTADTAVSGGSRSREFVLTSFFHEDRYTKGIP